MKQKAKFTELGLNLISRKLLNQLLNLKILHSLIFLPPATKLGQGYIFTGVCDSVHGGGGCWSGGAWSQEESGPGGVHFGDPPGTATAADGTHPTGMHSC